jgi:PAS domain S-box-containing protein
MPSRPLEPRPRGIDTASEEDLPASIGRRIHTGADLYRLLVESVQDYAIFALDAGGHVVSWNIGAARLKGYTADEIVGRHFSVFYREEDVAAGRPARLLDIAAGEEHVEDQGWRVRRDGSHFWANVVITALRDDGGHLVGFAKVTRDLTERREAELRAIEDARRVAAAEAASKAKSEFLAVMSHELRTPLNAIGGYLELLAMGLHGPLTLEQQRDVERIQRAQHHLLVLINDVLNYSRIEAGKVDFHPEPVQLEELANAVLPLVESLAAAAEIRLVREPLPSVAVLADRTKAEQIVLNLLTNAVKFTPAGGSVVIAGRDEGQMASLTITDTGPGIDPADQERIFEPFVQVGRTLSTGLEGTGLGLAISRDLARGMGGDLRVASSPGSGASFILEMPAPPR